MNITIVGTGYVGMSLAVLIAQKYNVVALDISQEKVDLINKNKSPIKDEDIEYFLLKKKLMLKATLNMKEAYTDADYIIIATPTNFDIKTGKFDTSSVEKTISDSLSINKKSTIIIKSTIPLGFTDEMRSIFNKKDIIFSPEFLRESKALHDNLYPSRIVIGDDSAKSKIFGNILLNCSKKNADDVPIINMSSIEAEAVKLFSNTFLAMRISYFNELDSFAETRKLSSENIIKGISSDPRIGNYYNNPSFGYGGYCLPKDTKQLLNSFQNIPNNIMTAVVDANKTRKNFIVNSIINKRPKTVGIYRLVMKEGSDNFRESAVIDITKRLIKKRFDILVYEPSIENLDLEGTTLVNDFSTFVERSDLIVANRISKQLKQYMEKVYTRDIFLEN